MRFYYLDYSYFFRARGKPPSIASVLFEGVVFEQTIQQASFSCKKQGSYRDKCDFYLKAADAVELIFDTHTQLLDVVDVLNLEMVLCVTVFGIILLATAAMVLCVAMQNKGRRRPADKRADYADFVVAVHTPELSQMPI